jgi:alpha-1,2-mannosyltransferase
MSPNPASRCLATAAAVTVALVATCGLAAAMIGDTRVLRPAVFLSLIGLSGGLGVLAGVWRAWPLADEPARPGLLLSAAAVATAAWQIAFLHTPSDDYRLYELAARQWVDGGSLYDVSGHNQLPTLLLLIGVVRVVLGAMLSGAVDGDALWRLTYGVYELTQLLAVIALVAGLQALASRAGASPQRASILSGSFVAFALPVRESIANNQINLPTLALAVAALAMVSRHPLIGGASAALGGALKLYPLALLLEWTIARRWKAVVAALGSIAALGLLLSTHWREYASFLGQVSVADAYRHAGLHAIVMNTSREVVVSAGGGDAWRGAATAMWLLSIVCVVGWTAWLTVADARRPEALRRPLETGARVMAAVLLVFPLAWTHHFVFALPLVICLWANGWPTLRIAIGTALLLFVPAFDIYPLGVHRLVGLFLVLLP